MLVVRTASRVLAVRVPEWYKPPQDLAIRDWPFPEPFLGETAWEEQLPSGERKHGALMRIVRANRNPSLRILKGI